MLGTEFLDGAATVKKGAFNISGDSAGPLEDAVETQYLPQSSWHLKMAP